MGTSWYSKFLARHPHVVLVVGFVLSTVCFIVPLVTRKFPDFSDPQLGFEARGTPLAQRLTAWKNLIDSPSSKANLIDNPLEYYYFVQETNRQVKESARATNVTSNERNKLKKHRKRHRKEHLKWSQDNIDHEKYSKHKLSGKKSKDTTDEFFCNAPSSEYARVVISSEDQDQDLWTLNNILGQCHIDASLRASSHFSSLCQRKLKHKHQCCRSWSPANYIALLANRTTCFELTEEDLAGVKSTLQSCLYFYQNQELSAECAEDLRCQRKVSPSCYIHNAAYHLLHYFLESSFISNGKNANDTKLRSVLVILPMAVSSASFDYYNDMNRSTLSHGKLHVTAMQFGLKSTLFDKSLISDSVLVLLGFAFITICIWFYTGSLLITLSTIFVVIFSLGISYAIYTSILRINLFPFMNILTIVVAVGIGSDDAFIFCKTWECTKRKIAMNADTSMAQLTQETMKHAVPTMFMTTVTTAVAFFASIVSNVTAINCFSIFSGITVIVNFLLMITWLPAAVIIAEKSTMRSLLSENFLRKKIVRPLQVLFERLNHIFTEFLVSLVVLLRWLWFSIYLALAIGSCFVVFRYPGLQLPNSPDFQLFDSSHLFEQYDLLYSKLFRFEQFEQGAGAEALPLRFVWGILPVDNGNYLNPHSRGSLVIDQTFNITDPRSQIWLEHFCKNVRLQPFYRSTLGPLLPNCFIESIQPWMERPCEDPIDPTINRSPCCKNSTFPYEPRVLNLCAAEAIAEIHRTPSHLWNFKRSGGAPTVGLKFRRQNVHGTTESPNVSLPLMKIISDIQVVIVEYDSNFTYSLSFTEMDKFFNEIENWMQDQLATAPPGMKNGWFVSYLEFYELQRTLYEGTIWAIVMSMGLCLSVLALVTLNPFVSLYAITAVGSAITVTVAALILMDWKLNVLESVVVSTAIGLAVDFSLHYGVIYRASDAKHRMDKAKTALQQMGGPTFMAALTSTAAGALMLPSKVLPYIQIGLFLIIIMTVSWIYATFFLCALLAIAGPSSNFAKFTHRKVRQSIFRSNKTVVHESHDSHEIDSLRSHALTRDKLTELTLESDVQDSTL
ncbi:protein dispatched [Phymastichus coffea]|uniref:protein dispatched n=1 Tax=Phymastichus coffea TaxID=108790 RepID=UPI00273CF14F|nr:protein dispatched [Phymastichus coffea]